MKYGFENGRKYTVSERRQAYGMTIVRVYCPFCELRFSAFTSSFGGHGKKCPSCGALHINGGMAFKEVI